MRGDYYGWLRNDMDSICDVFENKKTATTIEKETLVNKYAHPLGRHLKNFSTDIRYSGSVFHFCYSLSRLADETQNSDYYEFYPWFICKVDGPEHNRALWRDEDILPLVPPSSVLSDYDTSYSFHFQKHVETDKNNNFQANPGAVSSTAPMQTSPPIHKKPMTLAKRSPGRPRKHPLPKQVTEGLRKSPPKSEKQKTTMQVLSQTTAVVPTQTTSSQTTAAEPAPLPATQPTPIIPQKRKPGRPRKHPLPTTVVSQSDQVKVKEYRGRGQKRVQYDSAGEVDELLHDDPDTSISNPSTIQPTPAALADAGDVLNGPTWTTLTTTTMEQEQGVLNGHAVHADADPNVIPNTTDIIIMSDARAQNVAGDPIDLTLLAHNVILLSTFPPCRHCTEKNGDTFPPKCTFKAWGEPCEECRRDDIKGCINELVRANAANVRPARDMHDNYFRDRVTVINIYAKILREVASVQSLVTTMMNGMCTAPIDETNPDNSNAYGRRSDHDVRAHLRTCKPHFDSIEHQHQLIHRSNNMTPTTDLPALSDTIPAELKQLSEMSITNRPMQNESPLARNDLNNSQSSRSPLMPFPGACETDIRNPRQDEMSLDEHRQSPIPAASISSSSLDEYSNPPLTVISSPAVRRECTSAYFWHIINGGNPRIFSFLNMTTSSTSTSAEYPPFS
ncbi:hypothetical protein BDN70DRAFT_890641 [Pholiota conissans]|uniref:Uncharacterized protein n=1 Tax=Pholiota conissans TaxID=109636 RepID=A0A9P6D6L4_9AGAR|nr:hypothetical protein BDN70DRAFT_890641 [Pholiota conissans]